MAAGKLFPVSSDRPLYEQDFYSWSLDQADKLRAGRYHELDREHLAERFPADCPYTPAQILDPDWLPE